MGLPLQCGGQRQPGSKIVQPSVILQIFDKLAELMPLNTAYVHKPERYVRLP
jgi:hypothetical protein